MVKIYTSSRYKVKKKVLSDFAQGRLQTLGVGSFLVNIIIVGKRKMKEVAKTYKQKSVALPVLSFTYNETVAATGEQLLLGEIFLCYPQAVLLAAERSKGVDKMLEQLISHGIDNLMKN